MTKRQSSTPLQDLADRIDRLRAETGSKPERRQVRAEPTTGLGMAFAISTHMVAGLGVGGGFGYFLDQWLETSPLLLIVFFVLGAAAGFLNVYRTVTRYGMAVGYRPAEESKPRIDDGPNGPAVPNGKEENGA